MNYHALGLLPPNIRVLDGGGLTSETDSGKLRSTLKIHEGGRGMSEHRQQETPSQSKAQPNLEATIPDVIFIAKIQRRVLARLLNSGSSHKALIEWRNETAALLCDVRPSLGRVFGQDIEGAVPNLWDADLAEIERLFTRHLRHEDVPTEDVAF